MWGTSTIESTILILTTFQRMNRKIIVCRSRAAYRKFHSSRWSRRKDIAARTLCRSWLPTSSRCLSTSCNNSKICRIWKMGLVQFAIWKPWTAVNQSHLWPPNIKVVTTATLLSLLRTNKLDRDHLNGKPPLPAQVASLLKTQEIWGNTRDLQSTGARHIPKALTMTINRGRVWHPTDPATALSTRRLSLPRKRP